MEYYARYSILNEDGALIGIDNYIIEDVESKEEAIEMAFEYEKDYSSKKQQLFLDWIEDEDGNEIEYER